MTERQRLELLRPRDLGGLFGDTFNAYFGNLWSFLAIGAAVVVPVELVVSGLGLGQLTGGYEKHTALAESVIAAAEAYLVIGPLVSAMVVHALLALADGRRPSTTAAIVSGLEAFTPVFAAVLMAAVGIVAGFLLIVVGIWLLVRWYFVPQAVVVDGRRGAAALQRSAELVTGSWWRVLAIVILAALAAAVPASLIQIPFDAWAKSADSAALTLAGQIVSSVLTTPFAALLLTLLYFDLLARRNLPTTIPPVAPPTG